MIKTKKQMYVVIGVFALVMLLGTISYAFFNYTRTGLANTISTGQINFSTTQTSGQDGYINLTNVFPVDVTSGVPTNDPNVGSVTINVTGDTTYTGGIEYLVTAENVQNTIGSGANAVTVPIGISVTATSGLGTSDDDYFTDVRNNPQTSIYKVLATDVIEEDEQLVVGYIKSGQDGVNGNITIKAYLDASKIAISDTYYENVTTTPTPTAPNDEYGTPASFGEGRTVLTTTEWNSLQSSGVSFQVKVQANEGVWVEEPLVPGTILSCPGCKFIYTENTLQYGENGSSLTSSEYTSDYRTLNKNYFLGVILVGDRIDRAFACGIKQETPNQGAVFCIEGSTDGTTYNNNVSLITGSTLWNDADFTAGRCTGDMWQVECISSPGVYTVSSGYVSVGTDSYACSVDDDGFLSCFV